MTRQKTALRHGALSLLLLLTLVLFRQTLPLMVYLETGRLPQLSPPAASVPETVPTAPQAPTQPALPAFSDLSWVQVYYRCDARPELSSLLAQPLAWNLRGDGPTVLILHSHATESFAGTTGYRSQKETENMLSIGAEVARILQANGIHVLHDKTLHDYPSYDGAYSAARKTVKQYLAQYPGIALVLDLHRDASDGTAGQLVTSATVGGQKSAQLMLVLGTDENLRHPHWQENLALGLKLSTVLEQENPGITRPLQLRQERFNMDLSTGFLLVEVGAAGNSHQEALIAANALAQAIVTLASGTG